MTPGTYWSTSRAARVVVSQVDEAGERFDLEYLDANGEVVSYRPNMPRLVVRDLQTLERWTRNP